MRLSGEPKVSAAARQQAQQQQYLTGHTPYANLPPAARPGTLLGDPASVIAPGAIREVAASRRRARPGYDDDGSGGCRGHGAARHAVGVRGLHVLWELWEPCGAVRHREEISCRIIPPAARCPNHF